MRLGPGRPERGRRLLHARVGARVVVDQAHHPGGAAADGRERGDVLRRDPLQGVSHPRPRCGRGDQPGQRGLHGEVGLGRHHLLEGAAGDELAVPEEADLLAVPDRGQPVGHDDDADLPGQVADGAGDGGLGAGVERRGRLVHDQHERVGVESPGHAQALALPARQGQAALPHRPVDAVRAGLDDVEQLGAGQRPADPVLVDRVVPPGESHVAGDGRVEEGDVLGDVADPSPPVAQDLGQRLVPHADLAGVRLHEAQEDVDQRRLAGAGGADEGQRLAERQLQADVADRGAGRPGVGEGDPVQDQAAGVRREGATAPAAPLLGIPGPAVDLVEHLPGEGQVRPGLGHDRLEARQARDDPEAGDAEEGDRGQRPRHPVLQVAHAGPDAQPSDERGLQHVARDRPEEGLVRPGPGGPRADLQDDLGHLVLLVPQRDLLERVHHLADQPHGLGGGAAVLLPGPHGAAQDDGVEQVADEEEVDDRRPGQDRLGHDEHEQHRQEGEQLAGELAERDEDPGDGRGDADVRGADQVGGVAAQPLGPGGGEGGLEQPGPEVLLEAGEAAGGPPLQRHGQHRLGDDEAADEQEHVAELRGRRDHDAQDGDGELGAGEHRGQHERQQADGRHVEGREQALERGKGEDEAAGPGGQDGEQVAHGGPQGFHDAPSSGRVRRHAGSPQRS